MHTQTTKELGSRLDNKQQRTRFCWRRERVWGEWSSHYSQVTPFPRVINQGSLEFVFTLNDIRWYNAPRATLGRTHFQTFKHGIAFRHSRKQNNQIAIFIVKNWKSWKDEVPKSKQKQNKKPPKTPWGLDCWIHTLTPRFTLFISKIKVAGWVQLTVWSRGAGHKGKERNSMIPWSEEWGGH